jgi:RNA polymerase sigma-70 factor (ECF subfamily)
MRDPERKTLRELAIHIDDTDLMVAIQMGERVALEKLYLGYHLYLTRFLIRFTARHALVQKMIDDVFTDVWRHAKEFRFESQVAAWIFGIAYRIAMQSSAPGRMPLLVQSPDLNDSADYVLMRLPLEQRVTVTLAYQLGFSRQEIAKITGCSIDSVNARMFRGCSGLRDSLRSAKTDTLTS